MKILSRLVFRRFDDVILESRAPLGKQPIREHFARPLDGKIRREHPHIRRCPDRAMVLRQFRIKEIGPDRHVDPIPTLRVQVGNGARSHHGVEVVPHRSSFIGQPVKPNGILRVEQGVRCIHGHLQGIRCQGQLRTLRHQSVEERPTFRLLQRVRQSRIGHPDELEEEKRRIFHGRIQPRGDRLGALRVRDARQMFV